MKPKSARRFRLGPATTFAIAAGIVIAYVKWPDYAKEAEAKRELQAIRAEISRRGPSPFAAPKNLDSLWNGREKLRFSAAQIASISSLRAEEAASTADLKRETDAAEAEFSAWMDAHRSGATMSEISSRAADFSAKSGELARARRAFWERGWAVLNESQRKILK